MIGAHDNLPTEETILCSRVLFIDHYGMAGNLRAASLARAAGIAVVADFENSTVPLFDQLLPLVDHLVLSEEFAKRMTRTPTASKAAQALWNSQRSTVIITAGANGCWSVSPNHQAQPRHHPAFAVKATDTTGCGDVFHGAYAISLARGDNLDHRIRFASAAAALKAEQNKIPRFCEVMEFLNRER
jgi:sugar/nucleoside kinase (ribokinase family)